MSPSPSGTDILDDIINSAIAYGASFPDVYDWTTGEAIAFISAHIRKEKEGLRTQALMDMTAAATLAKMLTGQAGKMSVMDVYYFLWTQEERNEAKRDRLMQMLENKVQHGRKEVSK